MSNERTQATIDESKLRILERDHFRCQYPDCLESATEMAHGIGQGTGHVTATRITWNNEYKEKRTYSWIECHVIHNDLNMSSSCRKHNSYFNIGFNPGKVKIKLDEIRKNLIQTGVINETL